LPKVTVSGSGPKQRKLVRVKLSRCMTIDGPANAN
jgi:hypothetical protein